MKKTILLLLITINATAQQWTVKTPTPTMRSNASAVVVNGKIYVVGGWPQAYNILEEYDPATDQWTTKAPAQIGREQDYGAAVLNNQLYFIGGKNKNSAFWYATNEVYDPMANSWTFKDSLPQPL